MGKISRIKIDSKGRIKLPLKDVREIFIVKLEDLIIASPKKSEVEKVLKILDEYNRRRKLEIACDWFNLVDKAGLRNLDESKIKKLLSKGLLTDFT